MSLIVTVNKLLYIYLLNTLQQRWSSAGCCLEVHKCNFDYYLSLLLAVPYNQLKVAILFMCIATDYKMYSLTGIIMSHTDQVIRISFILHHYYLLFLYLMQFLYVVRATCVRFSMG